MAYPHKQKKIKTHLLEIHTTITSRRERVKYVQCKKLDDLLFLLFVHAALFLILVFKLQGAHEKVINALAGAYWKDQHILFSGGWDKIIKKWKIDNGKLILDSSCETDIVINAITAGEQGDIYVGGSDGHIIRIRAD